MFAQTQKLEVGGHKYEVYSDCFDLNVYYVSPEGVKQEIPVHRSYMTPCQAVKIHAMNMCGYCP